jgi:hypothetical protein
MVIVRVNRRTTCTHYGKGGFSFTVARPIFGNDRLGNPTNGKGPIEAAEHRHPSPSFRQPVVQTFNAWSPARRAADSSVFRFTSSYDVGRQHGKPPGWW